MSEKKLEISVYSKNSLLIKDYIPEKRCKNTPTKKVLSDDIFLPGYENKPIKIGFNASVLYEFPKIFIQTSDLGPDDVDFYNGPSSFEHKQLCRK